MGSQYMIDLIGILIQGIVNIQDRSARIAEDGIHSLFQKAFYDDFSTC
jgi:hypothetical protein